VSTWVLLVARSKIGTPRAAAFAICASIKKEGTVVITLDDLEYSYPDDEDHCYCCGRKWDSHSPWQFFYLDNHLLCEECAPEYRRARSRRETKQE
jgi:hypothetical protein